MITASTPASSKYMPAACEACICISQYIYAFYPSQNQFCYGALAVLECMLIILEGLCSMQ